MKMSVVDSLYLAASRPRAHLVEWRRWSQPVPTGAVRVFYGHESVPGRDQAVSGGMVKLHDLMREFPNQPRGANILYLVSSALPHHVADMVRLARRAGARVVLNQNGVAYPAWYGSGYERANRVAAALVAVADHVFYQSEFARRASDRYLGSRGGPADILHNPVDTACFVPSGRACVPMAPVLLVAGSHWHEHRVRTAVMALGLLRRSRPGARLRVAGRLLWAETEAKAGRELQAWANEAGCDEAVDVVGHYSQKQAVGLYQSADVLINAQYNDVCPRVVVEAMACGLPVVYSSSGGTPELVGADAGLGVEVPEDWERLHEPDPTALADAVNSLLVRHGVAARAARKRAVDELDVKPWLLRHRRVFEALVG